MDAAHKTSQERRSVHFKHGHGVKLMSQNYYAAMKGAIVMFSMEGCQKARSTDQIRYEAQ